MNKTQKKFADLLAKVPEETKHYVAWQGDIAVRVGDILEEKNWSQKQLADAMGWNESQVTRLLAGHDNLTLKTIAKLSTVLEQPLINVAGRDSLYGLLPVYVYPNNSLFFQAGFIIRGFEQIRAISVNLTGRRMSVEPVRLFSIASTQAQQFSEAHQKDAA